MRAIRAAAVALLLGSVACARPEVDPPPSPLLALPAAPPRSLSSDGRRAYDALLDARTFDTARVGIAGTLSGHAFAFRLLLAEKDARGAFLSLLRDGTLAGRLYGLAGVYFAAPDVFDEAVRWLETSRASVPTVSGCILGERPVASIVRDPEGTRVKAGQLPEDAAIQVMDIAGGLIPLELASDDRIVAPRGPAR